MRYTLPLVASLILACSCIACLRQTSPSTIKVVAINPKGDRIADRITLPAGYTRVAEDTGSFAACLRNASLKPHGTLVHYFDGRTKQNNNIYVAVIDMPIGDKNL